MGAVLTQCHAGQCIMHPRGKENLPRNVLNSQRADYQTQAGAGGHMLWGRRVEENCGGGRGRKQW